MAISAAARFWEEFISDDPRTDSDTPYQVWYFGNSPEMSAELVALVIEGKKTATASLLKTNELRPDEAPTNNGYSVVTDFEGNPICIVQTTEIRHQPFRQVGAEFAAAEGEDDLSLEYWRGVHKEYFEREAALLGFDFDEDSIVCCERFRLLYTR